MEENYLHGNKIGQARGWGRSMNPKHEIRSVVFWQVRKETMYFSHVHDPEQTENVFKVGSQKFKGKIENASGP